MLSPTELMILTFCGMLTTMCFVVYTISIFADAAEEVNKIGD